MALIERMQRRLDLTCWEGKIPMNYRYTVGRAGERFFQELKRGNIIGAKCKGCNITYVPPRIYCEKCFARLEESYVSVGLRGTVYSFTECYEAFDGSRKEKPSIVAIVRLDGTQGGLYHRLGNVSFAEVRIGMQVEAVFRPPELRQGSILDIEYFEPVRVK